MGIEDLEKAKEQARKEAETSGKSQVVISRYSLLMVMPLVELRVTENDVIEAVGFVRVSEA